MIGYVVIIGYENRRFFFGGRFFFDGYCIIEIEEYLKHDSFIESSKNLHCNVNFFNERETCSMIIR